MLNLNKREKIFLMIALGAVLLPIAYFKIIIPYRIKWKNQSLKINESSKLFKSESRLVAQKDDFNEKFESLVKKIQAKLPLNREESQFLKEIQKVAADTYVHIGSMNPLPVKEMGSFRELSVEIELEANLGNLVRFLYYLRKSSVVLVVQRLRLEPKKERSALLNGHLVISTIFLKK